MFTEGFGKYVSDGDTIKCTVDGFELTATVHHDPDAGMPWEREDGHGPVSEWTSRDKQPGERVLSSDRQSKRFYNFAEAVEIAKRDGWDAEPFGQGTAGERAARAAEADFKALKAWCNDEWTYAGVAVTVEKEGVRLTGKYDHALWGIEINYPDGTGPNPYLLEVANEEVSEALEAAKAKIAKLCAA